MFQTLLCMSHIYRGTKQRSLPSGSLESSRGGQYITDVISKVYTIKGVVSTIEEEKGEQARGLGTQGSYRICFFLFKFGG